ncbi:Serine/threonine-protein kinase gad8 [Choanephora cucurbitarum]|uniref:Serine/threonine-protein kinase gad8 n=1 Tax=Choanephora cucurbitarum TaxID=101091 RepID=A0A1C7NK53_9FUNG|nr:Serine/threonine-protein kinase gad8 [Choanephora cucurbitarum]
MDTIYDIKVNECPILVKDSIDQSWKTVPEFNITIKTAEYTLYIIRYIPDLYNFDHLVKTHYTKIKIHFPHLTETLTKAEKRRSIRTFFHISHKSNAEKVEKYLIRCSVDPTLKISSLLRDFFSPQREGDLLKEHESHVSPLPRLSADQHISSTAESSLVSTPSPPSLSLSSSDQLPVSATDETAHSTVDNASEIARKWVLSPHPSSISVSNYSSRHNSILKNTLSMDYDDTRHLDEDEDDLIHLIKPPSEVRFQCDPLDNLEMLKVLGKGCMGKVLLVRSRTTKELYALKSIIKEHVVEQREITHTLDEQNILTKLSQVNHPFLTKLHLSFQDQHRLYLLTNYYCGGDLATHMAKLYNFTPECALFYAAEMIEGIGELHRLGILYRDLKPENILLTGDGHIILTDFGLSKWLEETDDFTTQTFCGTAEYLAPEILLGESYSFGIDHWSFGTILYEMIAGITPFWADNHADMYKRVLEDPLEFPSNLFDYETAEFLSDILDRDPRTRLGANGIDEIKKHVYFADISWDDIRQRRVQPPYLPPVKDELDLTNFDQEFLTMSPALTPVSSEIELSDEMQGVFDNYSFTDIHYLQSESIQPDQLYDRQAYREDGFYDDSEDEDKPSQVARKRGSVSMLSNLERIEHPQPVTSMVSKDEEHARYAKRRNTSTSEEHANTSTTLVEDSTIPSTLVVMKYDITTTTHTQEHTQPISLDDTTSVTEATAALDNLEFSQLPDLRLAFHMEQPQHAVAPPSTKSSKTNTSSKTRRFLSLLL